MFHREHINVQMKTGLRFLHYITVVVPSLFFQAEKSYICRVCYSFDHNGPFCSDGLGGMDRASR